MKNLKLIEDDLVSVYETSTGERVVYGTELHEVLGVKTPYKDWSKRRFDDVDAEENVDFEAAQICAPSGQTKKDHIIKLDTAKEMAMLERNEKGKQVRRYFIEIEKKYKTSKVDTSELSPQLQFLEQMWKVMAQKELEDKERDKKIKNIEEKQDNLLKVFDKDSVDKDFQKWVDNNITQIVKSQSFDKGMGERINYALCRDESYSRLKQKWNCNLDDRVRRAKKRALDTKPDITKKELDSINKLSIISADKNLKPIYETVIKEMMIYYCVK